MAREKESIFSCYVLEPGTGRLLGSVSLRDLVMAEMDRPLTEVMRKKPITVDALDDQKKVADKIAKYNLLAVPVLEKDGSVVGFVTVDDVIDVLIEEQTQDILRMGAVEAGALDKPYFENPVARVVRKRIGWLLLLFVAGTLTSTVLHLFEDELSTVVALSFFIPLLIGTGGNAGAQTVMTVIRSLTLGEIRFADAGRVVLREAGTGLVLGPAGRGGRLRPGAADRRRAHAGAHGVAHHDRDLPVVHDRRLVRAPRRGEDRRGSGRPLRPADHDARGRDRAADLLLDRQAGAGTLGPGGRHRLPACAYDCS